MKTKTMNESKKGKMSICPCDISDFCRKSTDQEIIEYVKQNKECYAMIVERYENKLSRYIKRISGVSDESAEDILQEVFLKVYRNLNSYDPQMNFSSWIYRITHNETVNNWRKNKKAKESVVSLDGNDFLKTMIKDPGDMENEVIQKIANHQLREALDHLSGNFRDALILNYLEGASYKEISAQLGKPIGTVGTLINRGKKILREELVKVGLGAEMLAR